MNAPTTVRTGNLRSALRGTIVLLLGGSALLAAKTMTAGSARGGMRLSSDERAAALRDADHTTDLLNAVRGISPIACRLADRALQNNWGNNHGMVDGPESIGAAGDSVFEWAVSDAIVPATIPQLRTALEDSDACVRRTAASLLGRVHQSGGIAADLTAQLSSTNTHTREAALLAIGYAGKKGDVAAAEHSLSDPDAAVKLAGVWALGMIGDAAAVPALTGLLKNGDAAMRANAAYALGNIESTTAIPSLVSVLGSDSDATVRRAAAAALGRIDN